MKKSTVFKKIGFFAATLMLVALMVVAAVSLVAVDEAYRDVTYSTASISVDGSINLKFYITDIGSLDEEGAYLAVRVPDESGNYTVRKVTRDDLEFKDGRYILVVRLAAAQQTEAISVQLIVPEAGWSGEVFTYSISKYSHKVLELARDKEDPNYTVYEQVAIPLKTMLNYGAMAQTEFTYKTENKANEGIYSNEPNMNPADTVNADHFVSVPGTEKEVIGQVNVAVLQAQYESEINAFVYIKSPLEKPVVTVKLGEDVAYTVRGEDVVKLTQDESMSAGLGAEDGWYQIVIENIPSHLLDREITVTAKVNDNNQSTLTCSLLNYLEKIIVDRPDGVDDKQIRTAQALYNFYAAMKVYTGSDAKVPLECSHKGADGNLLNYYVEILEPATCQAEGRQINVCAICSRQIEGTEETIAQAEHKYSIVVDTLPTCTSEGTQHKECDNCDATMAMDNIPMLDHSYEDEAEVVTEATCTTDGVMTAKCKFCGIASNEQIVIPAFGHDFDYANSEITTDPTCTAAGVRTYTCKNCGGTTTETVAALGHTYGEIQVTKEATCTDDGLMSATCTVCGVAVSDQVIPATGHKYARATCEEPATCTVCDATDGEPIGHKTTKATCVAPEVCYICNTQRGQVLNGGQGHILEALVDKGYITTACTVEGCGEAHSDECMSLEIDDVTTVDHNAGTDIVLTVRLYNNPGVWSVRFELPIDTNVFDYVSASESALEWYECGLEGNKIVYLGYNDTVENVSDEILVKITLRSRADVHEDTEYDYTFTAHPSEGNFVNIGKSVIDNVYVSDAKVTVKGHTPETIPGTPSTCSENGLTDGIKCSVCDIIIEEPKIIPTTGHDAEAATCTSPGECRICGQAVTPAIGHSTTPYSTLVDGKYVATCTVCEQSVEQYVNVLFDRNDISDRVSVTSAFTKEMTADGVKFINSTGSDANAIFFENINAENDTETGKYIVIKYRSSGATLVQLFTSTESATPSGSYSSELPFNNDGEWHILMIDASISNGYGAVEDKYYAKQFRLDIEGTAGCWAEIAYVGLAASEDQVTALADGATIDHICSHYVGDELPVYEVIGDGSGKMYYATCSICGEKIAKAIPIHKAWWNTFTTGGTATYGQKLWSGWASAAGGLKEAHFTITNANDPTETAVVVVPAAKMTYNNENWPAQLGGDDRYWVIIELIIADWENVNGKNFNGDTVTVTCELVLRLDPTATPLKLRLDNGSTYSVTLNVENHTHTPGEAVEEVISAPTCTATGTKAVTIHCTGCDAIISQTTEEIPATGHTAAGSDGEYCKVCKTFLNADPNNYFGYFWGGENVPNGGAKTGTDAETGYNVYNIVTDDHRTQLISTTSPTVSTRYLVIKYKTDVEFRLQLYVSTRGDTALNANRRIDTTTLTAGGWKYTIVDLTKAINYSVLADSNGKYLLNHLTVDYDWLNSTAATAQIAYIGLADTADDVINGIKAIEGVDAINEDYCPCPEFALVADGTCKTTCALCGNVEEYHSGGTDGEYCKVCKAFVNADPSDYFGYFWGGENVPNGSPSAYVETAEDTGYNVYNVKQSDYRTQLISNASPTVSTRYLVIKYKTDVEFRLQLYVSTRGDTALNANRRIDTTTLTAGGWKYTIVDLTKAINYSVLADSNGKYLLNHLTVDYDWLNSTAATAQIAYIGLADTEDDVINGIKAIEGVDAINEDYCPCDSFLQKITSLGADTHAHVCQLCGQQYAAEKHSGATHGVWNEEAGYYESDVACTVCGEKYNFGCTIGGEAEDLLEAGYDWQTTKTISADGLSTRINSVAQIYTAMKFYINPNGVATGKYLVMRYRATTTATAIYIVDGANNKVDINPNREWNVVIVELAADLTNDARIAFYNAPAGTATWAVDDTFEIDWVRLYDDPARIPDEYKPVT